MIASSRSHLAIHREQAQPQVLTFSPHATESEVCTEWRPFQSGADDNRLGLAESFVLHNLIMKRPSNPTAFNIIGGS